MRAGLLFVTVIGFVSAVPLHYEKNEALDSLKDVLLTGAEDARNSVLESLLLGLLEQLREFLVRGTETIPPLDPLTVDRIHLDDQTIIIPGAFFTLNDLAVKGLSTFRVDNLQTSIASIILQRHSVDFDIAIPELSVNADNYEVFARLLGAEIFGKGDMNLRISNPRIKGNVVIGLRFSLNGIFLSITSCRISFGLDSFEPEITGMFNDEGSSEFVSAFFRNLVPEALDFFEEDITDFLSSTVFVIGNLILADLDIGSLLPLEAATL